MYGYPQQQPMYGGQPGFQQPMMQQPMMQQPVFMPPPQMRQAGPTVINITKREDGTKCPFCGEYSENRTRKSMGCVTWCWCLTLAFTVPPLFFIPLCVDGCKDVELVCEKCGEVKNTIKANCC